MKKIYSSFWLLLSCIFVNAQSGNNCTNAIPVIASATCTPTSHSTTDSLLYFSFTATSPDIQINVTSSIARCVAGGHPHQLTLFGGTCAALQTIEDEFMPDIAGCTEQVIDASNLTTGATYYIRVSRGDIVDSNCTAARVTGAICFASQPLSFSICVRSLNIIIPKDFGLEPAAISHSYYTNKGQIIDDTQTPRFDIKDYTTNCSPIVYHTDTSTSYVFSRIDTVASTLDTLQRVDMTLVGANTGTRIFKTEKISGNLNYFRTHVPTGATNIKGYSRTIKNDIYPNIDMQYYSNNVGIKFYFIVKPGGNADNIVLNFGGANSVNVTPSGGLNITTTLGNIDFEAGHAYQINPAGNVVPMPWQAEFIQLSPTSVKFDIRNYPANFPLFIQVDRGHNLSTSSAIGNLEWSTWVGGNTEDQLLDVKTDSIGNVYATGFTASNSFPTNLGYQNSSVTGDYDAVIVKFDSVGDKKYSTYFGSTTAYEDAGSIEIYPNGNIIICGFTQAGGTALPTKKSSGINSYFQNISGGSNDGFITKIRTDTTGPQQLLWSTYFGSTGGERLKDLKIDPLGNLYVVGQGNNNSKLRNHAGAYYNTTGNALVAKFDTQDSLVWCTTIAGAIPAAGQVAVDAFGNAFVTGQINQTTLPIVNPVGAFVDSSLSGSQDGYIVKFNPSDTIAWSTYIGGLGQENAIAIAVDGSNNIVLTGTTASNDFPIFYPGGNVYIDSTRGGNQDIFIMKFKNNGFRSWSTYYGGNVASANEIPLDIAFDASNNIYITGYEYASTDFPVYSFFGSYFQWQASTNDDAFILSFQSTLDAPPAWSTYFGSTNYEQGRGAATYKNSKLYIVGWTQSNATTLFNQQPGGAWVQGTFGGAGYPDGFISRFNITGVQTAGVEDITSDGTDFLLFPNPTNGNFSLLLNLNERQDIKITVYNMLGEMVYDYTMSKQFGLVNKKIDISKYSSGIYVINILVGEKSFSKKIILEK